MWYSKKSENPARIRYRFEFFSVCFLKGWTTPFWIRGPLSCSKTAGQTTKSTRSPLLVKNLNTFLSTISADEPKSNTIGGSCMCIIQQSSTHLFTNGSPYIITLSNGNINSESSLRPWKIYNKLIIFWILGDLTTLEYSVYDYFIC